MRRVKLRDYLQLREQLLKAAQEIAERRALEYAGADDVLANFRLGADLLGLPVTKAIFIRMCDKIGRLARQLQDEEPAHAIYDTVIDLINYAVLLYVAAESEKTDPLAKGAGPVASRPRFRTRLPRQVAAFGARSFRPKIHCQINFSAPV